MSEEWKWYVKEDDLTGLLHVDALTYLENKYKFDGTGNELIITWLTNDVIVKEYEKLKHILSKYYNFILGVRHVKKSNNIYSEASLYSFVADSVAIDHATLKQMYEESKNGTGIWKYTGITMDMIYNRIKSDDEDISISEILSDDYFVSILNILKEAKEN